MTRLLALLLASVAAEPYTQPKAALRYTTSWVGNTFSGGTSWVQNNVDSLQVLADGTLVVGSFWDEAGREVGLYKDGRVVGQLPDTHMRGGFAAAASDKYIFYVHTCAREDQPEVKAGEAPRTRTICEFGVSRYTRAGKHSPFPGGVTRFKNMKSFRQAPDDHSLIPRGVTTDGKLVYVADTALDTIKVIDVETMSLIREFPAKRPEALCLDRHGDLWAVSDTRRVTRFGPDGKVKTESLTLPEGAVPNGLGLDGQGRLLICDNGPRQQVHVFDIKQESMPLVDSLGEKGGMFAGPEPGKVGPWRFAGPKGAGVDTAGNLYVACSLPRGGTVLRAFSPEKGLKWELLGLEFVDVADVDTTSDGRRLYSADEQYDFDPKGFPGLDWKWVAHTLDPFRYPDDLRLHVPVLQCGTSVRTLGGKTFLCQRGMWQGVLGIYRIDGSLAVPSVVLASGPLKAEHGNWKPPGQPRSGRYFWHDTNGDGQMGPGEYTPTTGPDREYWASNVDDSGDIWQGGRDTGIWRWRFLGLDEHSNPRYAPEPEHQRMPEPLTDLLRTEYIPASDTMYLTGQTKDRPISGGEWGLAGTVVLRFDDWSKTPKLRYQIDLPYESGKRFMSSFALSGDLALAVDCKTAEVFVYDNRDGRHLGSLQPGPEVHRETGWVDFRDALRATRLRDGNYLVTVEEDWKGKSLVYRLEDPLRGAVR